MSWCTNTHLHTCTTHTHTRTHTECGCGWCTTRCPECRGHPASTRPRLPHPDPSRVLSLLLLWRIGRHAPSCTSTHLLCHGQLKFTGPDIFDPSSSFSSPLFVHSPFTLVHLLPPPPTPPPSHTHTHTHRPKMPMILETMTRRRTLAGFLLAGTSGSTFSTPWRPLPGSLLWLW